MYNEPNEPNGMQPGETPQVQPQAPPNEALPLQPYPPPSYGAPQYQPYPQHHPYKDMGGWLLFFVICTVLGIVSSIFSLFGSNGIAIALQDISSGNMLPLGENLISLCGLALNIAFLVLLFRRDPRFLRFRQLGWIPSFINQVIFAVSMLSAATAFASQEIIGEFEEFGMLGAIEALEDLAALLGMSAEGIMSFFFTIMAVVGVASVLMSILFFFLMTRYYSTSIRVRTYMGSDQYLRLAAFTKKANPQPAVPDTVPNYANNNYNEQELL